MKSYLKNLGNFFKKHYIIILLVILGFILRTYGIQFGKPFRYHSDEIKLVIQAGNLLDIKNINKETFFILGTYPPFFTYVLFFAFGVFSMLGLVVGIFPSMAAVREYYYLNPFVFHLIGRYISALMGTATISIIYLIGKNLYDKKVGLLSAAFLTFVFIHVRNSHFATVDIPVTFFTVLAFLFIAFVYKRGDIKYYCLSGLFSGLAIATKYNVGLIILPFLLAHFFNVFEKDKSVKRIFLDKKIYFGFAFLIIGFLMGCPLPILDFKEFLGGLIGTAKFESAGKLGTGGGFFSYITGNLSPGFGVFAQNSLPEAIGLPLVIISIIGIGWAILTHKKQNLLILVFPLGLYIFLGSMNYKTMRQVLPLIPFLILIAAVSLEKITGLLIKYQRVLLYGIAGLIVIPLAYKDIRYDHLLTTKDTRTIAKKWIEKSIPNGAQIAVESYGPQLLDFRDPNFNLKLHSDLYSRAFRVFGTKIKKYAYGRDKKLQDDLIRFIQENKIEYVISDSFTRQTFYWERSQKEYPFLTKQRQAFYNWLEKKNILIKQIKPQLGGSLFPEIKIYQIVDHE